MFETLKKYLSSKLIWVKCGGFRCDKVFQVRDSIENPQIFICEVCQEKMNQGIVSFVHAHTGKIKGNFHLIDGYGD